MAEDNDANIRMMEVVKASQDPNLRHLRQFINSRSQRTLARYCDENIGFQKGILLGLGMDVVMDVTRVRRL